MPKGEGSSLVDTTAKLQMYLDTYLLIEDAALSIQIHRGGVCDIMAGRSTRGGISLRRILSERMQRWCGHLPAVQPEVSGLQSARERGGKDRAVLHAAMHL